MKTEIHLQSFFKTARWGNLEAGLSTKKDVINLMGQADDFAVFKASNTGILKYGWYEFFYFLDTELLYAIQNDHLAYDCLNHNEMILFENDKVILNTWLIKPNRNTYLMDILRYLSKHTISFDQQKVTKLGKQYYRISSSSGVWLEFMDTKESDPMKTNLENKINHEKGKEFLLSAIRYFNYE